jgi:hypothetical protein
MTRAFCGAGNGLCMARRGCRAAKPLDRLKAKELAFQQRMVGHRLRIVETHASRA